MSFLFKYQKIYRFRFENCLIPVRLFNRSSNLSKWFSKKNSNLQSLSGATSPSLGFKSLVKPFVFTITFSGCCFIGASIWQYEEMRKRAQHFMKNSVLFDHYHSGYKRFEFRRQISSWWQRQTEGEKIASIIIGINLCVFACWRIPRCFPLMEKYFISSPALKASCLPMVLSTFSHYSFFHLAANMYVLYSFSTIAVDLFGKEQFLALYGSAGVISSFASYVHKVMTGRFVTSLGASGALMAILSSVCFQFPDTKLQIVFLPFFTFTAGYGMKAIMTLDLIGLLARWKLFDHAAHLGGALFGLAYLAYGREYIWSNRQCLFTWYHKIRER